MKLKFELKRSTVNQEYKQAIDYMEEYLKYRTLKTTAEHFELSINTIQKVLNDENVSSKTMSKIRTIYCSDLMEKGIWAAGTKLEPLNEPGKNLDYDSTITMVMEDL